MRAHIQAELPSVVDLSGKKVFLVAATLRPETMCVRPSVRLSVPTCCGVFVLIERVPPPALEQLCAS